MKIWRSCFVSGVALGGVLVIIGIYTESMPVRNIGVVLPLVGIGLGFALGRNRARRDEH